MFLRIKTVERAAEDVARQSLGHDISIWVKS